MNKNAMPTGVKLQILKCVAKNPSSASEVAKHLKISLPYSLTQLTLLEAKGLIKSETKHKSGRVGKPRKIYELTEEHIEITLLGEGFGKRFACKNVDPQLRTFFQLLSVVNDKNKVNFSEYYWKKHQFLRHVTAVAIVRNRDEGAELVAITTPENLIVLREQISTYVSEQGFTIACWVHTKEEFSEGLKRNDNYYIKLIKKAKPMLDTRGVFEQLGEYNK